MTRDDIVALFASRQDALARRDVDFIASQHAPDCEHVSPLAGSSDIPHGGRSTAPPPAAGLSSAKTSPCQSHRELR